VATSDPDGRAAALPASPDTEPLTGLLAEIRACRICAAHLPLGPRPVLVAHPRARLLITGQAPGTKVHASGIPWDDASGVRLRRWLGLDPAVFYDPAQVAIVPMGFCYPGKSKSGDLPPRPECRAHWHDRLFAELPGIRLKVVIGQYALAYHLAGQVQPGMSLTEVVADWRSRAPRVFVLPHPSPRNQLWLRRNPWFEAEVVPVLQAAVRELMAGG
jgi:uracil-DNA glycosylase